MNCRHTEEFVLPGFAPLGSQPLSLSLMLVYRLPKKRNGTHETFSKNKNIYIFFFEGGVYVTSFSVFHFEATVSIGLRNVLRMVTSILQNQMSMLRSRVRHSLSFFYPSSSKVGNILLSLFPPLQLVRTGTIPRKEVKIPYRPN